MKRVAACLSVVIAVLAVATTAMAASMGREAVETDPQDRDRPAPFAIQARLLQIGRGWFEVETRAVQRDADLEPTARLLIVETARHEVLEGR